jgi:hypothetical protein
MKTLFLISVLLVLIAEGKESVPMTGVPAKTFYLEMAPGETKSLKFETLSEKFLCEDRLDLKAFQSTTTYPSNETAKATEVKVINIYANKLLTGCLKKGKGKKLSTQYETPKSKNMIHIYITTDEDIAVKF